MNNQKNLYIGIVVLVLLALVGIGIYVNSSDEVIPIDDSKEISNELNNKPVDENSNTDISNENVVEKENNSVPVTETVKPDYILKMEQNIQIDHQIEKLENGNFKVIGEIVYSDTLAKDEKLNHLTEEIRFDSLIDISDIKINVLQGESFPSDDLKAGSHGAYDQARSTILITIINMEIDSSLEAPVPVYELEFNSADDVTKLDFLKAQIKVDTHELDLKNQTTEI